MVVADCLQYALYLFDIIFFFFFFFFFFDILVSSSHPL